AGVADIRVPASAATGEPWMDPPADRLALHFMHGDQVLDLPPGGVALGGGGHRPVAPLRGGTLGGGPAPPPVGPASTPPPRAAPPAPPRPAHETPAARAGLSRPTDEGTMARWLGRALGAS